MIYSTRTETQRAQTSKFSIKKMSSERPEVGSKVSPTRRLKKGLSVIELQKLINKFGNGLNERRRRKQRCFVYFMITFIAFQTIGAEWPISGLLYPMVFGVNFVVAGRAQGVTFLDELEVSSGGSNSASEDGGGGSNGNSGELEAEDKMKNLDALLETLPLLSVGQKHAARFECELNTKEIGGSSQVKLVWIKLTRSQESSDSTSATTSTTKVLNLNSGKDDIKLISLDQKLITPDKRFKVNRQSAHKWTLTLENVQPNDGNAYYLCQASSAELPPSSRSSSCKHSTSQVNSSSCEIQRGRPEVGQRGQSVATSSFMGGARLNVLAPPKIVEQETSASLVVANEHETLTLKCKVLGEPQSQLMWKREDNRPLDGIEQQFRHESQRKPNHQILSIDSSELSFEPFLRIHAGAYLCIASNGIQPGVSQRINVIATNCRSPGNQSAPVSEPCDRPAATTLAPIPAPDTATSSNSNSEPPTRRVWRIGSGGRQESSQIQQPSKSVKHRVQADKRRAPAVSGRNALSEPNTNGVSIRTSSQQQQMDSSGVSGRFGSWILLTLAQISTISGLISILVPRFIVH